MKKNRKTYSLDQSPLYKISTKKKLAEILYLDAPVFQTLAFTGNYEVFKNKKDRIIQRPIGELRVIHDRLQTYFSRISIPEYVHSKKGRSYITNAISHTSKLPLIKTDITKFYPSTSFSSVFKMFRETFLCAEDVAWCLANICCYQGHLPTGSPISGSIAFFAHKNMFDQISTLAFERKCVFTLFVDDLGISGFKASKNLLFEVRGIIRKYGLATSDKKSKTYGIGMAKKITGVVMTVNGPQVPNQRLLKIHRLKKDIKLLQEGRNREEMERSLKGCVQEAFEIEKANKAIKS